MSDLSWCPECESYPPHYATHAKPCDAHEQIHGGARPIWGIVVGFASQGEGYGGCLAAYTDKEEAEKAYAAQKAKLSKQYDSVELKMIPLWC